MNREKEEKILEIKNKIKNECVESKSIDDWFFDKHLLSVEKYAKFLLEKLPEANSEEVLLSVWLHDIQRIRGLKGDHAKAGAQEAVRFLQDFKYDETTIKNVEGVILAHPCDSNILPQTLEEKILASADAMSHYSNDFYFLIAVSGRMDLNEFKEFVLEKLDRDFNKKIFFNFAKEEIKDRHDVLMKVFTMN